MGLTYANIATASNDFSVVAATAPWLYGIQAGAAGDIEDGPSWTDGTAWSITAAGDGTTGTVTILRTTAADGAFIVEAT